MSVFSANRDEPLHIQVADRIKGLIARSYPPGQTLPPYLKLSEHFGVGLVTIKRAMDVLAAKGIVTPLRRRGTVVNRRLRSGETKLSHVGLVVRSTINRLFDARYLSEITSSLCMMVDHHNADLRIFSLHRRAGPVRPEKVVATGVDGVILLGVHDSQYIARFARQDTPLVVLDHHADDIALDYVACDNARAVSAVVSHLVDLGHRRIAFAEIFSRAPFGLGPADAEEALQEESDRVERRENFVAAMRAVLPQAEAPVHTFTRPDSSPPDAVPEGLLDEMTRALCTGPAAVTAVVTDDESTAAHLIAHLARRGIRVPGDVSVAAVAGPHLAAAGAAPLTYCRMRFDEMGRTGMELLELRTRTPRPPAANVVRIGFDLVAGATTAPPKA